MARPGTGPVILHSCLSIIRRASCESDFRSLYDNQYSTICKFANPNPYAVGDKFEHANGNSSSFPNPETQPDGNLESNDTCACFRDTNGSCSLNFDSTSHAHAASDSYTNKYTHSYPLAHARPERSGNPRGEHSGSTIGDRRVVAYTHPDANEHAHCFVHAYSDRHADAFLHAHTDSDPDGYFIPHADSQTHTYFHTSPYPDFVSHSNVHADPNRNADRDSHAHTNFYPHTVP